MDISGRLVRIGNHRLENLEKMFLWSRNQDLIELECGNLDGIPNDLETFKINTMSSLISNNAEASSSFCHFGIYNCNDQIIGYADLQDIDNEKGCAELSVSIPDLQERNLGFGFEAFLLLLDYSFTKRQLSQIIIRTRADNDPVRTIAGKLEINYSTKIETMHSRKYEIVEYKLIIDDYKKLMERFPKNV